MRNDRVRLTHNHVIVIHHRSFDPRRTEGGEDEWKVSEDIYQIVISRSIFFRLNYFRNNGGIRFIHSSNIR